MMHTAQHNAPLENYAYPGQQDLPQASSVGPIARRLDLGKLEAHHDLQNLEGRAGTADPKMWTGATVGGIVEGKVASLGSAEAISNASARSQARTAPITFGASDSDSDVPSSGSSRANVLGFWERAQREGPSHNESLSTVTTNYARVNSIGRVNSTGTFRDHMQRPDPHVAELINNESLRSYPSLVGMFESRAKAESFKQQTSAHRGKMRSRTQSSTSKDRKDSVNKLLIPMTCDALFAAPRVVEGGGAPPSASFTRRNKDGSSDIGVDGLGLDRGQKIRVDDSLTGTYSQSIPGDGRLPADTASDSKRGSDGLSMRVARDQERDDRDSPSGTETSGSAGVVIRRKEADGPSENTDGVHGSAGKEGMDGGSDEDDAPRFLSPDSLFGRWVSVFLLISVTLSSEPKWSVWKQSESLASHVGDADSFMMSCSMLGEMGGVDVG